MQATEMTTVTPVSIEDTQTSLTSLQMHDTQNESVTTVVERLQETSKKESHSEDDCISLAVVASDNTPNNTAPHESYPRFNNC